jgi:uncharacterized protein YndB with AHSA1/START domain
MKSQVSMGDGSVRITRVFDAPRPLVFSYWKDAGKLQKWSGCKEARNCQIEMDFRVGGGFTQKMHIEGAGDFTITGHYDEIVEPERISYSANLGGPVTHVLVEFFEEGQQTKVVLTHDQLPEQFCKFISQGTDESFDKLEQRLVSLTSA